MTGQQLQQMLPFLSLMALVFGGVMGMWVALEAWNRGSPKVVCALWFFAILIFPAVIVFYALMRIVEIVFKAKSGNAPTGPAAAPKCPYCGEPLQGLDRICPHCGKLL